MAETRYLTTEDVVGLHDVFVERCGGPYSPLIHPEKLESALFRPQQAAWYEGADHIHQAVLLAVGVSQAQAFLDGNKRAALATFHIFLITNGYAYRGEALPLARWIETIAVADRSERGSMTEEFEAWLRGFVCSNDGSTQPD